MARKKSEKRDKYMSQVADMYFNSRVSIGVISKKLSIPPQTIWDWICIFAEENGIDMGKAKLRNSITKQETAQFPESDIYALRDEIRRLEAELKRERMRADLNEEIIKVAEEKFNIKIRKKAGAKR